MAPEKVGELAAAGRAALGPDKFLGTGFRVFYPEVTGGPKRWPPRSRRPGDRRGGRDQFLQLRPNPGEPARLGAAGRGSWARHLTQELGLAVRLNSGQRVAGRTPAA